MSHALGLVVASVLPIYPWRTEVRSFLSGGGGDRIAERWSLNTLLAIREAVRYEQSPTLALLVDAAVLVLVASALGFAIDAGRRRLLARRDGV